jgi:hypothetical protein
VEVAAIPDVIALKPPASADAIRSVSQRLPTELPEDYAALLTQSDGVIANTFILYSCDELPERNETFEVGEYAPGYVAVGDDNGGRAIILRGGRGCSPVFLVGHGTMQPADMVRVAESLSEWIGAGCPLDADA